MIRLSAPCPQCGALQVYAAVSNGSAPDDAGDRE
jgi:hypothetical protein